jgi:hypothetical protein
LHTPAFADTANLEKLSAQVGDPVDETIQLSLIDHDVRWAAVALARSHGLA